MGERELLVAAGAHSCELRSRSECLECSVCGRRACSAVLQRRCRVQDDSSVKLINLHHYEKRRRQPVHWSVRLANAAQTHSEDHAIRIASREDGSMAVTWVDFDRTEPPPWPCDPDARSFLDSFMKVTEADVAARQRQRAALLPSPRPHVPLLGRTRGTHTALCASCRSCRLMRPSRLPRMPTCALLCRQVPNSVPEAHAASEHEFRGLVQTPGAPETLLHPQRPGEQTEAGRWLDAGVLGSLCVPSPLCSLPCAGRSGRCVRSRWLHGARGNQQRLLHGVL
jgi:hypothetical protein